MTEIRFDQEVAAHYDESMPEMYRPEVLDPAVDFLARLAGRGSALEFGVGTGRVALPLSVRGALVHGIDNSPPMLEQLRKKAGADRIALTVGDFATTRVNRAFRVVYLVFNTITNLTTQDEQVACFRNAAEHLEPGGSFVVEVFVPQLRRVPPGDRIRVFASRRDYLGFDEYTDFAGQILHLHR